MATPDITGPEVSGDDGNQWSDDRIGVALKATHQIESLLYALRRELHRAEAADAVLMASVINRIKELNSVAMSVLDDDDVRETSEMKGVVFGAWAGEYQ